MYVVNVYRVKYKQTVKKQHHTHWITTVSVGQLSLQFSFQFSARLMIKLECCITPNRAISSSCMLITDLFYCHDHGLEKSLKLKFKACLS